MNNPGDANQITREYLDNILFEQRLIDTEIPDLSFELYGKQFSTPIMTPAFSHMGPYGEGRLSGLQEYSKACAEMNAVNWLGMSENDGFDQVMEMGAQTIRIVKPYRDREKVFDQLRYGEAKGALAVGIDIDHTIGSNGKYDVVIGEEMECQSLDMLKEYIAATSLPFILKGVLSVSDAAKCAELGIKGIVVSHHHGRLPFAIAPLMVLPEIRRELEGTDVKIFVDCHIDSGFDAFKALALGADAVSVGRAMIPALQEEGVDGVKKYFGKMQEELSMAMAFTGIKSLNDMTPDVLWNRITGKKLV